ncbi:acetate kinase [Acrasis kona]|uniref:Acetate kinase n=1 Tax=Acrasis kona TaxID=1008807 RepID=A0AAW2ZR83_9EUKA
MRTACPEHYVSKRKCKPGYCETRDAYGDMEMMTQDDYSVIEAIFKESKPCIRTRIKEEAKRVFQMYAPDAKQALKEFYRSLVSLNVNIHPRNVSYRIPRRPKPYKQTTTIENPKTRISGPRIASPELISSEECNIRTPEPTISVMSPEPSIDLNASEYTSPRTSEPMGGGEPNIRTPEPTISLKTPEPMMMEDYVSTRAPVSSISLSFSQETRDKYDVDDPKQQDIFQAKDYTDQEILNESFECDIIEGYEEFTPLEHSIAAFMIWNYDCFSKSVLLNQTY